MHHIVRLIITLFIIYLMCHLFKAYKKEAVQLLTASYYYLFNKCIKYQNNGILDIDGLHKILH